MGGLKDSQRPLTLGQQHTGVHDSYKFVTLGNGRRAWVVPHRLLTGADWITFGPTKHPPTVPPVHLTGNPKRRVVRIATVIVKVLSAVAVVATVVAGVFIFGRLASSDIQAIVVTTIFFAVLAVVLMLVVRRRRDLLVWLAVPFVLTAGVAGIWLGLPLVTSSTVDEQVASVQTGATTLATGQFEAAAHPGRGKASLVKADGETALTFTDFQTDNGPDLLVYLVPADAPAGSDKGAVDLGALKGNKGDQQYAVPSSVDTAQDWRVVVWCRAFAVSFTEAPLA